MTAVPSTMQPVDPMLLSSGMPLLETSAAEGDDHRSIVRIAMNQNRMWTVLGNSCVCNLNYTATSPATSFDAATTSYNTTNRALSSFAGEVWIKRQAGSQRHGLRVYLKNSAGGTNGYTWVRVVAKDNSTTDPYCDFKSNSTSLTWVDIDTVGAGGSTTPATLATDSANLEYTRFQIFVAVGNSTAPNAAASATDPTVEQVMIWDYGASPTTTAISTGNLSHTAVDDAANFTFRSFNYGVDEMEHDFPFTIRQARQLLNNFQAIRDQDRLQYCAAWFHDAHNSFDPNGGAELTSTQRPQDSRLEISIPIIPRHGSGKIRVHVVIKTGASIPGDANVKTYVRSSGSTVFMTQAAPSSNTYYELTTTLNVAKSGFDLVAFGCGDYVAAGDNDYDSEFDIKGLYIWEEPL